MAGITDISELVKSMTPELNKGAYVFTTVKDSSSIDRNVILCEFKETEGITLILEQSKADELELKYDYVASWITLTIHSSLEAIGLTATFSNELAKHNISCNVVAAYYHDHIFVAKKDAQKAMYVLQKLSSK
ncbi:ACT domain-containing protein [Cellulophaga baltica]|uniref:ACT domain-containing protein n=1 Tax=Cellulophaga TaxID=104264 RepID=UPI001C076F13|nr:MULTISPECIES: ACT domain-containing protein [Cellulophaga]MBU2996828.1 ACT domain-containing protein [Cellulophaga baltica]MDO6768225.1 ACT domain-containing protein [Cellulophaga sp. 1_MG-2023]